MVGFSPNIEYRHQLDVRRDHDAAMALGHAHWIKPYQCGLRLAQLYHGPLRPELREALRLCVDKASGCSAVPALDTECPDPVG